jgi:ParB family chromosome partitioning protein
VLHRWRKKLRDPDEFESTYETACARYVKIIELDTTAHVGQNSGDNEWFTPREYIEAARAVLGAIDLDPASATAANKVVQAATYFTMADDGLQQTWHGRVWMNPPYAQPLMTRFCEKLTQSVKAETVSAAVVLVNNATETEWFQLLATVTQAICFPNNRVKFWHPKKDSASPLQGQAVLYMGADIEGFGRAFATFGFVAQIVSRP